MAPVTSAVSVTSVVTVLKVLSAVMYIVLRFSVLVLGRTNVDERIDSAMTDVRLGPDPVAETVVEPPLGNGIITIPVPVGRPVTLGIEMMDEMVTVVNADATSERLPTVAEGSWDVAGANKELLMKGSEGVLV